MIQFPKRTQCFSFPALDIFPARRNIHIEILKSLTFSISSPSSWRLECGILQIISLVFVVIMYRPTSLAIGQSKSNWLWAFSKDEAYFFYCPICGAPSRKQWQIGRELGCLLAGHFFSPDISPSTRTADLVPEYRDRDFFTLSGTP